MLLKHFQLLMLGVLCKDSFHSSLRFSRKKKASNMIDLEQELFIIFARGAVTCK